MHCLLYRHRLSECIHLHRILDTPTQAHHVVVSLHLPSYPQAGHLWLSASTCRHSTDTHHTHSSVAQSSYPQAGHLWVGASHTPLRVLLLSRPATGWLEGTWLVSRYLVPRPSFVMMPGSVLPYSTTDGASASAPARAGAGGGAAAAAGGSGDNSFRGYIAKLQTALRGSGAGGGGAGAGDAGDEESGAGAGSGGSGGKAAAFQGTARVLGGSGAAGGSVVRAATAAAWAAEARMGGGAAAAGSRS